MEITKQIIIVSKNSQINNSLCLTINHPIFLLDDAHLKDGETTYIFDYLIFTNTDLILNFRETNILHEGGLPLTNFFFQTTYENIYFTSDNLIDEALQNINENE